MKFPNLFRVALVAIALGPLLSTKASAFIRAVMWDDALVDQSDLIVIAHLKENRFEIGKDSQGRASGRKVFFTTLVVGQILKGSAALGDLRVGLHDPNYPTVLGGPEAIVPEQATEHPDPAAEIGVAAIMGTVWATTTDDIRRDHIWFLRTEPPPQLRSSDIAGPPGLWFPEGVQPVKLGSYYQAIIKVDAKAVAAFDDQKGEWWSRRVRFASKSVAARQALLESDLGARCDELVKIYRSESPFSPPGILALKEIMDCGTIGAVKLIPLFVKTDDHTLDRRSILQAWQQSGYTGAAPDILTWLRNEETWWETKTKADMVFGANEGQKGGDAYNDPRAVSFRNIICSIDSLRDFHTDEARTVIERVRNHWKAAASFASNNELLRACDVALINLK